MLINVDFTFASGKKETLSAGAQQTLEGADELIENKQYSEALHLLTTLARQGDQNFDNAQKRFETIIARMYDFNEVANTLLDVIEQNPNDTNTILLLTNRLYDMGATRTKEMANFLNQMHGMANFAINRRDVERILAEGRALLNQGDYKNAVRKYSTGLNLYQIEFFTSGYGPEIEGNTRAALLGLLESLNSLYASMDVSDSVLQSLSAIQNNSNPDSSLQSLYEQYKRISDELENYIRVKNSIVRTQRYFAAQQKALPRWDPPVQGENYFPFADLFFEGQLENNGSEGILGAMDAAWASLVGSLFNTMSLVLKRAWDDDIQSIEILNFPGRLRLNNLNNIVEELPLDLLAKANRYSAANDVPRYNLLGTTTLSAHAQNHIVFNAMNNVVTKLSDALESVSAYVDTRGSTGYGYYVEYQRGAETAEEAMAGEQELRDNYNIFYNSINDISGEVAQSEAYYSTLPVFGQSTERSLELFNTAIEALNTFSNEIMQDISVSAINQYNILNDDYRAKVLAHYTLYTDASQFIDGIQELDLSSGQSFEAHYPERALSAASNMEAGLLQDITLGEANLGQYSAEPENIRSLQEIQELNLVSEQLLGNLRTIRSSQEQLVLTAREQIQRAAAYRYEGDSLYSQAEAALRANNFAGARELLSNAETNYNNSLSLQESPVMRAAWHESVESLAKQIYDTELAVITREVDNLIARMRQSYFSGNFESAESDLLLATGRWLSINSENRSDVVYWLNIVRGAMSLRGNRVISPTAPLYPEMSQLLSSAYKNYNEGVALINKGLRADGLEKFRLARIATQEVRLMFPVNQEASLLELRMEQVTDSELFNETFQRRMSEAIANTKLGSRDAFADLQDLAEINPRFPGIQAALSQAEIDIGLRPPPMDPLAIQQSTELVNAAQRLFDTRIRSQYTVVLEQLNRALQLNPDNAQAASLKDQVQTEMGGGTVAVDTQSEQEYQRAVTELQRGNTILAMVIMQRLMQKDANKNINRYIELQRRIQSLL